MEMVGERGFTVVYKNGSVRLTLSHIHRVRCRPQVASNVVLGLMEDNSINNISIIVMNNY